MKAFGAVRGLRTLSREKSDTLLLLGACCLVLLPHLSRLPLWIAPACALLLAARAWLTFSGRRMPSRWLLVPVALLAMAGVYASYRTLLGRDAGVAMLSLLLTFKLLEMHAKRDLFVALFLSLFLVLASFFYSQSIATALLTVAAVVLILTTLLSFQYTGAVPPLRKRLRLGATILGLAAPLTLVLFLLFPRVQGPLWGLPADAHAGRTGMSDTMSPGNISRLALSDEIAFRVLFDGRPPAQPQLYWRGIVLGHFDGRTWREMPAQGGPESIGLNVRGAPLRYQVTLEPHGREWLFALETPATVPTVAGNPARVNGDLQIMSASPVRERLRYDAASYLDAGLQSDTDPARMRRWLQLPAGLNPRTLAFAEELRRRHARPEAQMEAVLRHFRSENFRYTLEPPPLGQQGIDEFLFDTRAGFCEHYSGAYVFLMRALGIPARVVTGYQGGEINPADGYMTVRQSDAHAWAEAWLPGRGWVRVDPTAAVAPDRVERNLGSVVPRQAFGGLITLDPERNLFAAQWLRLRHQWEAIGNGWNQWVLNYTPQRQLDLVRSLGFTDVSWRTLLWLMLVLGSVALAVAVLPLILRQARRDPLQNVYERFCKLMARRGLPRLPHEGPRAYAARIAAADLPLAAQKRAALARFLEVYEAMRYGAGARPGSPGPQLSQLKSLLAECR
ncbi:transglutaminase family protein [Noviherbaspirillum aridicola]|uniref:Protein-glutamine gamma-glutamyltransferase n=1 Tax=Noviherbaspirillum aridicola TaxID=2849687 RepID=A0ABQ4Q422_9BURK|nr:transglutaminaseTgpA domain-containing protein [Noviherbaspirillum aridicola]GIZ51938.1 protein-glutamine gamma-glutamyltransferase [Noviherbaspirillum aridicola]